MAKPQNTHRQKNIFRVIRASRAVIKDKLEVNKKYPSKFR